MRDFLIRSLRGEGRYAEADTACGQAIAGAPRIRGCVPVRRNAAGLRSVTAEVRWHAALLATGPDRRRARAGRGTAAQHRFAAARELLERRTPRGVGDPPAPNPCGAVRTLIFVKETCRRLCRWRASWWPGQMPAGSITPYSSAGARGRGRHGGGRGPLSSAGRCSAAVRGANVCPRRALAGHGKAIWLRHELRLQPSSHGARAVPGPCSAWPRCRGTRRCRTGRRCAEPKPRRSRPTSPRVRFARPPRWQTLGRLDIARLALLEARSAMPCAGRAVAASAQFALRQGKLEVAATDGQALLSAHPRTCRAVDRIRHTIAGGVEAARAVLALLAAELPEHREVAALGQARLDGRFGGAGARTLRRVPRPRSPAPRWPRSDQRLAASPALAQRDLRAFLLVRNEAPRLPWLLAYYCWLGVDRSSCWTTVPRMGTRDLLLAQGGDVHLFHAWRVRCLGWSIAGPIGCSMRTGRVPGA